MVIESKISFLIGKLKREELERIILHFKNCKLPIKSKLIKKRFFYNSLIIDKKNINNEINMILLNKIGKAYYAKKFMLKDIKELALQKI